MEKSNLENLNKLAKLFGTDRLISPEEVQEIRGVLVGVLANNKKELESLTAETRELVNKVLNKVLDEHDTYLEKSKQIVQEAKSDTTEAIQATMKSLEEVKKLCKEVMECKPENGKDADEEYVIGEVLNRIKLPEHKEVVLDDGGAIVDKINSLPVNEENQIDAKHIKNLPEMKGGRVISGGVTRKIVEQMIEAAGGGSGSPGGSTTQLQYNNAGAFGGISGATTDGTATTYTTGNLKAADVKASGSGGLQILSNAGTVTSLHGAGGGANNTFYGGIKADYATATTVPYFDASKNLISSAVTPTELGYLSGVSSAIQTQIGAKEDVSNKSTSTSLGTSDTLYPTQNAVKVYVDGAVTGLLDLKGDTDCSTNPNYPSALKGDAYYVTVAGKIGGASGKTVEVGDVYVAKADNAGGTEASVGTSWFVLNQNLSGVALTSGTLAQFASTTSSQLAGVISDETGSGALVFANSPTLTAPKFADLGFIADANGNEMLVFDTVTSAVNEVTLVNAATTTSPQIKATGGDTNIDLLLVPKGTGIVKGELKRFMVRLVASDTDQATGTTIGGDYRISNRAITVKAVGSYCDTAGTTGTYTIDINEAGTSILSTKITVDSTEKSSETAATPPVISDSAIAADAVVTFNVDAVQTTKAKGLVVWIDYVYA